MPSLGSSPVPRSGWRTGAGPSRRRPIRLLVELTVQTGSVSAAAGSLEPVVARAQADPHADLGRRDRHRHRPGDRDRPRRAEWQHVVRGHRGGPEGGEQVGAAAPEGRLDVDPAGHAEVDPQPAHRRPDLQRGAVRHGDRRVRRSGPPSTRTGAGAPVTATVTVPSARSRAPPNSSSSPAAPSGVARPGGSPGRARAGPAPRTAGRRDARIRAARGRRRAPAARSRRRAAPVGSR